MRPLIIIRKIPSIDFMGLHKLGFIFSGLLTAASIVLFLTMGLNYGIDFSGGIIIEARTQGPADLAAMRAKLDSLGIGEISLQGFGSPDDVLIRVPRQPGDGKAQEAAVAKVKDSLGSNIDYRRTEVVGPKVGGELVFKGILATIAALVAIAIYVWFRFKWQFGVGAMLSTLHDTITTIGLFSLLQIEFNLTTLAAILTIAGYSINDTVVIYDRVRETMRKYKTMDFRELINKSLNETLSRTILTVSTTALAVLSLLIFGGQVLRGFSIAMLWGIVIGTYSSLFIAAPLLYYVRPKEMRPTKPVLPVGVPAPGAQTGAP
ncbi:MAG TPA: protein translocase subunit SecF [Stellaceae bacterium]|nr:protein translocase subunit SecF [Stellaceae bacterium]